MPVVAGPAAVIGAAAALWYLITLLIGQNWSLVSGILLGLVLVPLLSAIHQAPIAPVFAPPWRRSMLLGAVYAVPHWFAGAAAFGIHAGWLLAITVGMATIFATRRTIIDRTPRRLYHWALVVVGLIIIGEVIIALVVFEQPLVGAGLIVGLAAGVFAPTQEFLRWAADLIKPVPSTTLLPAPTRDIRGYQTEALALATFLAPVDIPRTLVMRTVLETEAGAACALKPLTPSGFTETGTDSLAIDPLVQQFAFQRLGVTERRAWAGRAVRMLAAQFPADYETNLPWCERLTPHAFIAAGHAQRLNVEQGAAAHLLNQVAGYLAQSGREAEAGRALGKALESATAAFGKGSDEAMTVRENLASVGSSPVKLDPDRGTEERHVIMGGLALIVLVVAGLAGFVLWRQATVAAAKPSARPLTSVIDLAALCADKPRYFRDATPYSGPGPHPVQIFTRHAADTGYQRDSLSDPDGPVPAYWQPGEATVHSVQLVTCVAWRFAGPEIRTCEYPDGARIPLHQATYGIRTFEASTGRMLDERPLTVTEAACPPQYVPLTTGQPLRLHAMPDYADYAKAIGTYVEDVRVSGAG